MFFYFRKEASQWLSQSAAGFSPPKGIRCFSTRRGSTPRSHGQDGGSGFSPPKGIRCFSTYGACDTAKKFGLFQSPEGDSLFFYLRRLRHRKEVRFVSVPRRGFVVFLPGGKNAHFQVPKTRFSPPKGIRCFSTREGIPVNKASAKGFSPPKGIRCFSTHVLSMGLRLTALGFSPPKGIRCFSTWPIVLLMAWCAALLVSVPRRGIRCFSTSSNKQFNTSMRITFQSPEGDSLFFYQRL